jgi:hypothetical protein
MLNDIADDWGIDMLFTFQTSPLGVKVKKEKKLFRDAVVWISRRDPVLHESITRMG